MKKLLALILLLAFGAALPAAAGVGVGAYGGVLVPVAQEDQSSGSLFGIKLRAKLYGPINLEPNLNFAKFGEATFDGVGTRDGSKLTHYGVDFVLGMPLATIGFKPFGILGGAIYNTKRDGDESTNKAGWSAGLGFGLGLMQFLDVDVRGKFHFVKTEGSATKKAVGITLGLTYYFGVY